MTDISCMADARSKFFKLHAAAKSQLALAALNYFGMLYDIERHIKTFNHKHRLQFRQDCAKPINNN